MRQCGVLVQHPFDQASILPPLAFSPNSRALITRVSLNTITSPGPAGWQIGKLAVVRLVPATQQTAGTTHRRRVLGNQVIRQVVIKSDSSMV
jgi:hypothetical protein